jgi:acetyl-CoA synthetase
VTWFEPFTSLLEWELPYAKWDLGGKLNITYNCVDRHVENGLGTKVAYYMGRRAGGRSARDHVRGAAA